MQTYVISSCFLASPKLFWNVSLMLGCCTQNCLDWLILRSVGAGGLQSGLAIANPRWGKSLQPRLSCKADNYWCFAKPRAAANPTSNCLTFDVLRTTIKFEFEKLRRLSSVADRDFDLIKVFESIVWELEKKFRRRVLEESSRKESLGALSRK